MWTSLKKVKITADATPTAGVFTVSLEEKYYNKKWDFRFREWNSIVYCSASDLQRNQNFEHKVKMVSNNGGIPDASMLKDVLHVSALTTIQSFL
jgi:hypothetical protein